MRANGGKICICGTRVKLGRETYKMMTPVIDPTSIWLPPIFFFQWRRWYLPTATDITIDKRSPLTRKLSARAGWVLAATDHRPFSEKEPAASEKDRT